MGADPGQLEENHAVFIDEQGPQIDISPGEDQALPVFQAEVDGQPVGHGGDRRSRCRGLGGRQQGSDVIRDALKTLPGSSPLSR